MKTHTLLVGDIKTCKSIDNLFEKRKLIFPDTEPQKRPKDVSKSFQIFCKRLADSAWRRSRLIAVQQIQNAADKQ